jgi:hypothetical protein
VKAGSGAVWVVLGAEVPPFVVVCLPVVVVVVVVGVLEVVFTGSVVVGVEGSGAGEPAAETVFVDEPHPPSSRPVGAARLKRARVVSRERLIAPMVFAARATPPRA